jgi:prolyl oligopeptidase
MARATPRRPAPWDSGSVGDAGGDEWRWLESLESASVADWVRERNAETFATLRTGEEPFRRLAAELREVLDAQDRIPYPTWRGDGLCYNFWRDAAHPRGCWRRTTLAEYRRAEPAWEVLLDLDALAADEGENWVWAGAAVRRPDYRRGLVHLSRGGADAVVVREFDLERRAFVEDGFTLPEAKSETSWIDADHIYVATDEGPGSLTTAGYPRLARRWRRGAPLSDAELVYQAEPGDDSVYAFHDPTPGYPRDFVGRWLDHYRDESYLRTGDGELARIPVPLDAGWSVHREWLVVRPRTDWDTGGVWYPAGALLAIGFDAFLAGDRGLTVLFEPDGHTALRSYDWTRNHLILHLLTDVKSRLEVLSPGRDGWRRAPLPAVPAGSGFDDSWIVDTDPDHSDAYLSGTDGFLRPATLYLGQIGGPVGALKRAPARFDPGGLAVRQYHASSEDGTRVPYFVVGNPAASPGPTLLAGYGGFEHSSIPAYDPVNGRAWLACGGTYAVANIRGGGEYGPAWHLAAIRERRPRAFEDFAAVARDLVARGITTPEQLGITGGSNGGLLMGVMLTRYPTLVGAVVAHVPLLDMRRYHRLLAGASWMAEYGDPDDPDDWAYLQEFSPYHQVRPGQPYPPILLITSTRDDRVHPGHARKMVARLRAHGYPVSYYENVEGGHGAAADNEQVAFNSALAYTFLRETLGLAPIDQAVISTGSRSDSA